MESRVRMALLYDFYGSLLTKRQQDFMELYFGEDLSLGEIAAEFNVSRQAVYDILNRAEAALQGYEQRLKLVDSFFTEKKRLRQLKQLVFKLQSTGLTQEQEKITAEIMALLDAMGPEGD
ncbi:MAG: YlxM family DNA-binding protein [Firmicutes bacterium]|jgi:predicted DNA-binding protein YlxM (UPF0122 family)|nr:YlxM family DNA-binding protein [Bacillota bacterium]